MTIVVGFSVLHFRNNQQRYIMPIKTNLKDLTPSRERLKVTMPLLSHGYTAPKSFPKGEITVYPWDNFVDDKLMELVSVEENEHRVMFDILPYVCNLNGCPIEDFVVGDVNTVLMVSRSIPKANRLTLHLTSPFNKSHHWTEEVVIPDMLEKVGEKTQGYKGYDVIELPVCKDVVAIRPLLVRDELNLHKRDKSITERAARIVSGVVTINDTQAETLNEYAEWYYALEPKDQDFLEEQQELHTPHLSQKLEIECPSTKKTFTYSLRLDRDFFRSDDAADDR